METGLLVWAIETKLLVLVWEMETELILELKLLEKG